MKDFISEELKEEIKQAGFILLYFEHKIQLIKNHYFTITIDFLAEKYEADFWLSFEENNLLNKIFKSYNKVENYPLFSS